MKILITGAGGFLGRHLLKDLLKRGYEVTNFSRSNYPDLKELGVPTIQGDLVDEDAVINACSGMDAVFHLASKVGMWGDYKDYYDINVQGTKNIIKACRINGIKKLVYTSSPSTVFGKKDLCGVNESQSYPRSYLNHYAKTKALAEKEVLKANDCELATVSLRPHLIFGPGDTHLFPRIVEMAKKGRLKQVGDGKNKVDVIYVQNAVDAHLMAFDKLEINSLVAGKVYFIGQEKPVVLWDFIDEILKRYNEKPVDTMISYKAAYTVATILELIYKFFSIKKEPPMTRFVAKQLSCSHYFSHKNAEKDLGYFPKITTQEALDLTVR